MVQAGNEPAVRFWLELHAPVNTRTWYAAHVLADDESGKPNLLPVMKLFFSACYENVSFALSPKACACRDGNTALIIAACYNHSSIVRQALPSFFW
jgi:hypothetical protein